MKVLVQRFFSFAKSDQAINWFKLISMTGGAQVIVQGIGFVSGILVIRLLSTEEYGLYTLANTMLGTMVILADGGISASVMSQGGKVWQDKTKLGVVIATGLDLRRRFAVGSLLVAIPVLMYLLLHHGAGWWMSILIVLCLIPAFFTSLSGTLLQIVPKLNQEILPLQKNYLIANAARLVALLVLFIFPFTFIAVLAYGVPQIWANIRLKQISARNADWNQPPDREIRKEILNFVKRLLPGSIYYCLSGQITIWLISIFGGAIGIAQVGALSRLGMTLTVFTAILNALVFPRFSKLPNDGKRLFATFFQIQLALFALCCSITLVVYLFPSQILWILGPGYYNLETELVLSIIGSCLALISGASFNLCICRGWAIHPLLSIPITLCAIVVGILLIDVSTLAGILKFNLFVCSIEIIMHYVYAIIRIKRAGSGEHIDNLSQPI